MTSTIGPRRQMVIGRGDPTLSDCARHSSRQGGDAARAARVGPARSSGSDVTAAASQVVIAGRDELGLEPRPIT